MNSQEPNENSDLQNEPRDGGSQRAEGAMAPLDSAEIEQSPELGLEIRHLEIKSQEPNENKDLQNELWDGGNPRAEGAMALPLVRVKKKSILINTEIIERDPEPERAWRSLGSSSPPNFEEILRTEAEIEKSPKPGLEIRNLEIKSQETNKNSDIQNELRDSGNPVVEGAMALPLAREKKKLILINTEIIEKDPEPGRAWRSSGSITPPNFAEILRTEEEMLPVQKFGPYAPPFEPNSGENSRNSSSSSHSSSIRYDGYYSSRQSHYI